MKIGLGMGTYLLSKFDNRSSYGQIPHIFMLYLPYYSFITATSVVISLSSSLAVDCIARMMSVTLLRLVPGTIQHTIDESNFK
jgi:hypothetical protein